MAGAHQGQPSPGALLDDRYVLHEVLGTGAVGVVYRAHDVRLKRELAVKILSPNLGPSRHSRSRFGREGQALMRLSHPNVVDILSYGITNDTQYIAMELLRGVTLEKVLEEGEPLEPGLARDLMRQVLSGLAYAHRRGIVHRDLKPGNVFLEGWEGSSPEVKLLDFGLAKFLGAADKELSQTLTHTGVVMGTPLYMAPEQATGDQVDKSADVYAAGSVFFEMLTGRPPFVESSRSEVVRAHLLSPVPRLERICEGLTVTPELQQMIETAMAKRPGERFADAGRMLKALRSLPTPAATSSLKSPTYTPRPARRGIQRLALAGLVAVAVGALALVHALDSESLGAIVQKEQGPWGEGVPAALERIQANAYGGQALSRADIREVVSYSKAHPRDPRPHLLLGHAFANKGWRRDSLRYYMKAFRVDARSRADACMLDDLLDAVGHARHGRRAVSMVQQIYGAEALPAVERSHRKAPPDSDRRKQLGLLKSKLLRSARNPRG
ncbi:MAG: serine/threonine protein kinase [Proteobacteria bacterium]|nr:serine/threonine protein kinase [Pseudomonadota bacterium]